MIVLLLTHLILLVKQNMNRKKEMNNQPTKKMEFLNVS